MSSEKNNTICAAPWKLLHLTPQGEVTSCFESSKVLGSLNHQTLHDVWHSEGFQKLRSQMIQGKMPEQCHKCFTKEKAIQGQSIRTLLNHRFQFDIKKALFLGIDPALSPSQLDLSFSNICNLKCRICGPLFSSSWVKELKGSDREKFHIYTLPNKKFDLEILPLLSSKVERIVLTGGEPFLDGKNQKIVENLAQKGLYDCMIEFNTNGTFVSQELVKLLVKFKKVKLNFSLDDFGERFELMRKGANWNLVQENVRLLRKLLPKAQVTNYSTISIFNIESFLDHIDHILKEELFSIDEITLHYLNEPSFYSVAVLPRKKKESIEKAYLKFIKKKVLTSFDLKDCQNLILQMKMVLNYMWEDPEEGARKKLVEECEYLDKIRGENVFEVFPHLKELKSK